MVVPGTEGEEAFLARLGGIAQRFPSAASVEDMLVQAPTLIAESVDAMLRLMAGHDPLHIVEYIRRHEFPLVLDDYRESASEQMPAAIDVVALIALTQTDVRSPGAYPADAPPYAELIPQLAAHARAVVYAAMSMTMAVRGNEELGPLRELAGQLVSHDLVVRARNYERTYSRINREVLGADGVRSIVIREFGFDLDDIEQVADAISLRYQESLNPIRKVLMTIGEDNGSAGTQSNIGTEDRMKAFEEATRESVASTPFTSAELVQYCDVSLGRIDEILAVFSKTLRSADPRKEITRFVHGVDSLREVATLRDSEGNHTILQSGINAEMVRPRLEAHLRSAAKVWQSYGRQRDRLVEKVAARQLSQLLGVSALTHSSLKYLAPRAGSEVEQLSRDAQEVNLVGQIVEGDGLIVVDDVAVCLEVKAGALSPKARSGNVQRVTQDLEKTVGAATRQAQRLEELILANGGLWRDNGKWLDLSSIREVHTVVVSLEDFGPLAIAADTLVRGEILTGTTMPWIVSLHDLLLIGELLESPAEFLLYLRRRTDPSAARLFVASDELDLVMWFLDGGFYFEPDPEELHARFPFSRRPSGKDRARYRRQGPVRVGTFTDPLDAWIYYLDGTSNAAAEKPKRRDDPEIHRLVQFLEEDHKPGWLRFGADLLNLSRAGQSALAADIQKVVARAQENGRFHSALQEFTGHWGYALLFVTASADELDASLEKLELYMRAKKHQLQADRALGIHLDAAGNVAAVLYQTSGPLPTDSDVLDEAVELLGLKRGEGRTRAIPPSARRQTVRLRGVKTNKRR